MHRRLVLSGALALAASPALAQSSPAPATDAPAAPAPAAKGPTPAEAPAMKMATPASVSDAAAAHIKRTMTVGSLSLALSRIAAQKVTHPSLRQFVTFEVAEQETIADIIKSLMMPGAPPTGTVKSPTDAELTHNLDPAGEAMVAKMREMKAGKAFDRDYVKAEIDGHRQLLEAQEDYLKSPDSLEETTLAKLARGMIKEHLTLLGDLEKTVG